MLRAARFRPSVPKSAYPGRRDFHSGWKGFDPEFRKRVIKTVSFETSQHLFREMDNHAVRVWNMDGILNEALQLSPTPKWYDAAAHSRLKQDIAILAKASEEFMQSLLIVDQGLEVFDRKIDQATKDGDTLPDLLPTV